MSFSSITRKFWMSITGLFLITFLALHLAINLLTLCSDPGPFNEASHFMATNPFIQAMQYVLALGFIMHIATGIILTRQNESARPVKYANNRPGENSSLASRSMIRTGMLIFVFLLIHLWDYWYKMKFTELSVTDYELVTTHFHSWIYTLIYVVSFVLLGIHLNHGFQSAFQSLGANHRKYTPWIKKLGSAYSVIVAAGFALIALYHFIFQG